MSVVCPQDVRDFLDNWQADPLKAKEAFVVYKDFLVGLSGVSLDKEMAKHAKNQLQYTALTQIMSKTFEGMSTIIQDGKQA